MPKHYTVVVGEYTYPADPISLRTIKDAGGVKQLTPEQKRTVKFKTVTVGQDCSDMPEPALSLYISRGWVTVKSKVTSEGDEA